MRWWSMLPTEIWCKNLHRIGAASKSSAIHEEHALCQLNLICLLWYAQVIKAQASRIKKYIAPKTQEAPLYSAAHSIFSGGDRLNTPKSRTRFRYRFGGYGWERLLCNRPSSTHLRILRNQKKLFEYPRRPHCEWNGSCLPVLGYSQHLLSFSSLPLRLQPQSTVYFLS